MKLSSVASGAGLGVIVRAGSGYEVRRVILDSRQAHPGDLFVAVPGTSADGHDHAPEAAARGAAIVLERPVPLPAGTAWAQAPNTRRAAGELAAALQGRPARRLDVVGITGSAGKSTTTHLTAHVLEAAGVPAGFLSTVAHGARASAPAANRSGLTTMDAAEVQAWLGRMAAEGAAAAVIESSSHAIDQDRVSACELDVAAFTNVASDHLDYHGTREAYLRAKARLIELCASSAPKRGPKTAVLNRDDSSYEALAACPIERRLTYAIDAAADVRAEGLRPRPGGTDFSLLAGREVCEVQMPLPARFNVSNALCAAACGLALGIPLASVAEGLSSFPGLSGRLERVDLGQPFTVFVDFAHNASSLASLLSELRAVSPGRLLAVFGATARSDHDPAGMGRAAAEHADFFVITSDDPLDVDPAEMARRVAAGAGASDHEVVLDRREAIRRVFELARPGDVVVLAGKGHERTLRLADGDVPWDERAEAEAALRALSADR